MECVESVRLMASEHLEAEMCSMASRVAAATCEFLLAVGEYDRRKGWQAWECRDMAQWLSWKCAMSPVTAREQVRVAHIVADYGLLRREFCGGRLTYSQVRAISRVVTAETEESLVELARVSTAAQLEDITRAYRRSRRAAAETAEVRRVARFVRYGWDDQGNLVGSFCLPAEDGAVLAKALEDHTPASRPAEADADGARDGWAAARADTLMELVRAGASAVDCGGGGDVLVTVIADETTLTNDDSDIDADIGECRIAEGPGIAAETARRLACDADITTATPDRDGGLDLGRRRRVPSRALRQALHRRDGHCQFPGCVSRRIQAHHIQHWAAGGTTSLDNLLSLCSFHHHRIHEGGYKLLLDDGGQRHFIHPNGHELHPRPFSGPILDPAESAQAAGQAPALPDIEPYTSGWDGSHLDLALTLDCLHQHHPHYTDSAESAIGPSVGRLHGAAAGT